MQYPHKSNAAYSVSGRTMAVSILANRRRAVWHSTFACFRNRRRVFRGGALRIVYQRAVQKTAKSIPYIKRGVLFNRLTFK